MIDGAKPLSGGPVKIGTLNDPTIAGMIDAGLLREEDLYGLGHAQVKAVVENAKAIHRAHQREAEEQRKAAERERQLAKQAAESRQQQKHEKRAAVFQEQAEHAERAAEDKTKRFIKENTEELRSGMRGIREVRKGAANFKPDSTPRSIPSVEKHALMLVRTLHDLASGRDRMSQAFALLVKDADPKLLPERTAKEVEVELTALIKRLETLRKRFNAKVRNESMTDLLSNNLLRPVPAKMEQEEIARRTGSKAPKGRGSKS